MLDVENVSKVYGSGHQAIQALAGIDLHVDRGEFAAIVGPSGSGKTSLLLTMGGLLTPTSGKVLVDGASFYDVGGPARTAMRLKYCGFMFQTFHLIPYLTAMENVQLPLITTGMNARSQREMAGECLRTVGLEERKNQKASKLSVGEMQRVALARALINRPGLILADEPTANLDAATAKLVIDYLQTFKGEGIAVVLVTHDDRLGQVADRIVQIRQGQIVEESDEE
ncbi:MAG: ABC transporter ATP-binding protein [Planctomycetota bacterium]